MHDEQDFLAAHGCKTAEEYDRKQFFAWVEAMEDQHAKRDPMGPIYEGIIIRGDASSKKTKSLVKLKPYTQDGNKIIGRSGNA